MGDYEKPDSAAVAVTDSAPSSPSAAPTPSPELSAADLINASGHKQELERNFSLLSLCAIAITSGNTWVAIGGSVVSLSGFAKRTSQF